MIKMMIDFYAKSMIFKVVVLMACLLSILITVNVEAETNGILQQNTGVQDLLKEPYKIPAMIKQQTLTKGQIPNPHWRKDACVTCHSDDVASGRSSFKEDAGQKCAYCHSKADDHAAIHPVSVRPDAVMLQRMPEAFRGKVSASMTCLTCHDLLTQCDRTKMGRRWRNSAFLRDGPYKKRTDFCYQCHDKKAYKKLNPHDQVNDAGKRQEHKCLICHTEVPQPSAQPEDVKLITGADWSGLCRNCHKWQPHPGGNMSFFNNNKAPDHLAVPSKKVLARMQEMSNRNDVSLRLEPVSERLTCVTCHNPHEQGVIRRQAAARGADANKRLRTQNICLNCHKK